MTSICVHGRDAATCPWGCGDTVIVGQAEAHFPNVKMPPDPTFGEVLDRIGRFSNQRVVDLWKLHSIEWSGEGETCPACGKREAHAADCWLAEALR